IKAMKQIAGMLRLDLAQFRELAAFAQFGSDLDKATLAQIERGKRMIELLKQDQYVPLPVEQQVMLIFAGTEGLLDDIPVEAVRKFDEEFLRFITVNKEALLKEIAEKKALDDSLKEKISQAVEEFKKGFKA
ncbi:MAG: F0F1 ATP synthase subunit alpha, partial [Thermodesulfovibrionia bacterium]|nr:F0F1 ATP synthase subunit alpha [Thermodesulfovibrionia bacterium]